MENGKIGDVRTPKPETPEPIDMKLIDTWYILVKATVWISLYVTDN